MRKTFYNGRVIHYPEEPVLILDDEPTALEQMKRLCIKLGIPAEGVTNGLDGLRLLDQKRFSLYIVDLHMPGMGGEEFIQELKQRDPDAIFLIESVSDRPETIIKLMKLGAHDYVIKPTVKELFWNTIVQALEYRHLKLSAKLMTERTAENLRNQLEWLSYKDRNRNFHQESRNRVTLDHLRSSLYQGGGYGMLLSLVELLRMSSREREEGVLVDGEILKLIFDNADSAMRNLQGLDSLAKLMNEDLTLVPMKSRQLIRELEKISAPLIAFMKKSGMELEFSHWEGEQPLMVHLPLFSDAVEELLVNALKYSVPESVVEVHTRMVDGYFSLGVKSAMDPATAKRIPKEWNNLALEPFTRFHPPVERNIPVEKFGIGLGLTAVNMIMNKHHGHFFLGNILDHTRREVETGVMAQLLLPVSSPVLADGREGRMRDGEQSGELESLVTTF